VTAVTHDEILAEVDHLIAVLTDSFGMKVLRSVVELHKPAGHYCFSCIGENGKGVSYPCPTIQVIEKGLM
jgi:hypothetical protein